MPRHADAWDRRNSSVLGIVTVCDRTKLSSAARFDIELGSQSGNIRTRQLEQVGSNVNLEDLLKLRRQRAGQYREGGVVLQRIIHQGSKAEEIEYFRPLNTPGCAQTLP